MKLKWVEDTNAVGTWYLRTDYQTMGIAHYDGKEWVWTAYRTGDLLIASGTATTQRAAKINARRAYNAWRKGKERTNVNG